MIAELSTMDKETLKKCVNIYAFFFEGKFSQQNIIYEIFMFYHVLCCTNSLYASTVQQHISALLIMDDFREL